MILARLFVIVGGFIVLVLMAALVGPYFVDWTTYRADFEREASAILGRKVTVEGAAKARLLPFPSVSFSDVSVGAASGGKPAMTIETFSLDAELAPFLRGEFLIFDMRMVRPKATIEMAANGAVDWAIRPSTPFEASHISLERLTVTEGQIEIRHAGSGRTHLLSEINAEISARSFAGPWRAEGTVRLDGMKTALSVSTGKVEAGRARLRIRADPQIYPLTVEADGNIRLEDGAALYSGILKILGDEIPAEALRGSEGQAVEVGALKAEPGYRLNGQFSLDHERFAIDEFRFETGPHDNPYTADGTAFLELGAAPRFSIKTTGAQVRFDEAVAGEAGASLSLSGRLAALEDALADLPDPAIPGSVEVNLPAIVAGDTTIRNISLSAEPAQGGWRLKSLGATLPGRTTLEADGFLRTKNELGFSGSLLLAVAQPSGFAAWLSKDVDDAIRRLPAAGFSAKVDLTRSRQSLDDLELVLGDAKFHGSIESRQPADMRPSMFLKLDGEKLDVDGLAAFASLFVSDEGANRFSDRDLDFEIKAGPVSAGGLTAESVDTTLRLRRGTLEIDRLAIGGLAGASISATGVIKGFSESPTGNLDASILAVDLAPLISLAAQRYPDNPLLAGLDKRASAYPGLFDDTRIDLIGSAAANEDGTTGVAVSIQGDAGGSAISATLSGRGDRAALASASLSMSASVRNDDSTVLMALGGVRALPLGMTGPGELTLSAKGALSSGLEMAIGLVADDFAGRFSGVVSAGGQGAAVKGKVEVRTADIEPWLMTNGVSLPGMGLGMPVDLVADADYARGLLVLAGLNGVVNENSISGDVNVEMREGVPHLTGALSLDAFYLDPAAAMVFGDGAIVGEGGAWSSVPFRQKAMAPLSAALDISTAVLSAGPAFNAFDATMMFSLDQEGVRASDLKAKLFGGDLSGLFELKNNGGTGFFSAQLKLAAADLDSVLPGGGVEGSGDFSTTLSASGKSVGGMVASLSGSGTAAFADLGIAGVDPNAFPAFIARADAIGRDIDAAKTAAFAPEIAAGGNFAAGSAELAFTVAGGVLRAPPVTLDNPSARLTAELRGDLNTGIVSANGAVAYLPGDEALVGSEPVLRFSVEGPLGATERVFDSEPLARFLTQRALEREQARVEAMQAELLEKQRLRREVRYFAALNSERERVAEERRKAEEARLKAEAEARARAKEEARLAEAQAKAEEEARLKAEAEAREEAEKEAVKAEEARLAAEAKARAEEAARLKATAEAAAKAEEEARLEAEAEATRAAEEAERQQAEEDARREAERKARVEAERQATPPPEIERAPLPEPRADGPAATAPLKKLEPFSIEGFIKSLGDGG